MKLSPGLEKFLKSIGINTTRLKWKLHNWEQQRIARQAAQAQPMHQRRYKKCRYCGYLALAEDSVCRCGRKLPSYTAYQISRLLALDRPETTLVSSTFIITIIVLFAFLVLYDGPKALMNPSGEGLYFFGAFNTVLFQQGYWWRMMTMALCHAGIIHILFNTIAISQMLPRFENVIGPWRTLMLITLTQIGAGVAHVLWFRAAPYSHVLTIGASGIAFGLIGFGLAYAHQIRNFPLRSFFFRWFIYGVIFGVMIGANNAAHVGGFLAGLPLGYWMAGRNPRGTMKRMIRGAGILCLLIWIVCIGFLIVSIANGVLYKYQKSQQVSSLPIPQHHARNIMDSQFVILSEAKDLGREHARPPLIRFLATNRIIKT